MFSVVIRHIYCSFMTLEGPKICKDPKPGKTFSGEWTLSPGLTTSNGSKSLALRVIKMVFAIAVMVLSLPK
jgi:hypothetical protein